MGIGEPIFFGPGLLSADLEISSAIHLQCWILDVSQHRLSLTTCQRVKDFLFAYWVGFETCAVWWQSLTWWYTGTVVHLQIGFRCCEEASDWCAEANEGKFRSNLTTRHNSDKVCRGIVAAVGTMISNLCRWLITRSFAFGHFTGFVTGLIPPAFFHKWHMEIRWKFNWLSRCSVVTHPF